MVYHKQPWNLQHLVGLTTWLSWATEQGWAIGRLGVEVRESGKWKNPVGLKRLASAGAGLENDYRSRSCVFLSHTQCVTSCAEIPVVILLQLFFANRFPAGPPLRNAFGEVLRPLLRFIVILSPAWHEPVNQNRYFDKEQLILSANFSQLPDANMQKFQGVSFSAIFFCHLNTPSRHRREVLWGHSHSGSPVIQLVAVQLPAPRHQGRDWGNETWNRNGG